MARLQELEIQASNLASAARPIVTRLTAEQASIAETAFGMLGGHNMIDAIKFFLANFREPLRKITIALAYAQFMQERELANLRPDSLTNLRSRLLELVTLYGQTQLAELGTERLRELIFKPNWGPTTRDNTRRTLHTFFVWAVKQGFAAENPVAKIDPIKVDHHDPAILTPAEVETLLTVARKHKRGELVPYLAIGIFSALRPTELRRISWSEVCLKAKTITLGANMAKMRAKRIVSLSDNLCAWLAPYAGKVPIVGKSFVRDFDTVRKLAGFGTAKGLKPWAQDIMRHSAISYHLAEHKHEGRTGVWAGNSPEKIQKFYKGLVTDEGAKKFWNIRPPAQRKAKIIRLATATATAG